MTDVLSHNIKTKDNRIQTLSAVLSDDIQDQSKCQLFTTWLSIR